MGESSIATVTNREDKNGNPFVAVIVKGNVVAQFPYPKDTSDPDDIGIESYKKARMDATYYCTKHGYQERDK